MDRKDRAVRWADRFGPGGQALRQAVVLTAALAWVLVPLAWAVRTQLRPGWNMFSPQQDVELGQQVSLDAEKQVLMLKDSRVDNYLNNLGHRLSAKAPGFEFPYTYKCVNDRGINAFALPGGHIYINRGVIETADNEAQLAGVMAHESAHVALRHGTNQASKASAAQVPLAILGGALGSNSAGAALAQLGAGFTVNSILLKYSRTAETQADLMGTQMLFDAGYDPRAMAQFFEKIQAEDKGGRPPEFFSSHPNPENRTGRVDQEIVNLGGPPRGAKSDSREFQDIKRYLLSRPAPPGKNSAQRLQSSPDSGERGRSAGSAEWPSDRMKSFENSVLRIDYPDNWQPYGQGDSVTITPRDGMVKDRNGSQALAYGVVVNIYEPHFDRRDQQQLQAGDFGQSSGVSLETATDRLIEELRYTNQSMRLIRNHENLRVDGERALSTYLSNNSPLGGRETNWLVTLQHTDGLLFLVFTAPEREFQGYDSAFQQMLYSVRMRRNGESASNESGNPSHGGSGTMTWKGRVDGSVELSMQGNRVRSREMDGVPTVNQQASFSSPLPRAGVRVSVNKRSGRGQVSVAEQPNQSNNYTAVIKIADDKRGADDYEIEAQWR